MILTGFLLFIPTLFFLFNLFLKDFRNQISAYLPFSFFLIFLPFFQLFLSWFTGMTIKNYYAYSIISYLLISLFFLFLIWFLVKKILNKKASFWNFKINFLYEKNYIVLSSIFIISFIILFILETHIFVVPSFQDTYYYAALTNKFKDNMYYFFNLKDVGMVYKISQSYYLYSVIYEFPNQGYDFLNRFSSYVIAMIIIFLILDKIKFQIFFSALIFIVFTFGVGFLFLNNYFLSAGNTTIQFIAISLCFALLYSSYKYKHFFSCLAFIMFAFFSITALILGAVYFIAYIITYIVKLDFKKIICVSPLILYNLFFNIATLKNSSFIIFISTIIIVLFSLILLILVNFIFFNKINCHFFYKLRYMNKKVDNLSNKSFLFFNNLKTKFCPKILFFLFFLIVLFLSFSYLFLTGPSQRFRVFLFFILIIYLIGIFSNIFIFKKNWSLLFIYLLVDFFSFGLYLFNEFYFHNSSAGRIFNLNSLQFSPINAAPIHFLTIFFILYFSFIKEWKIFSSWIFKIRVRFLLPFKILKNQKITVKIKKFLIYKNFILIKLFSISSVFFVFTPLIVLSNTFQVNFTNNFYQKYFVTDNADRYFTKNDVSWLQSLNSSINLYDHIFSDAPIWKVLSKGTASIKVTNNIFWEYEYGDILNHISNTNAINFLKNYIPTTLILDKPKYIIIWKDEFYTKWLLSIMGKIGDKLIIVNEPSRYNLILKNANSVLTYIKKSNPSSSFLFYVKE